MGKYCAVIEGVVRDFKYKRVDKGIYHFSLDSIFMGQLFYMGGTWSAIPKGPISLLVNGFKSRYYACEYILRANGVWRS